jgi:nucleotide-binding universal stress UspA family protein
MPLFQCILLATDGSACAQAASRYAQDLAQAAEGTVVVVHAYPKIPRYLGEPNRSELIARHEHEAEKVISPIIGQLSGAGIDVIAEILEGPPEQAILEVSKARRCDLIIMGCHGHSELSNLILGSVSHKVLTHSTTPVLVVPGSQ